MQGTLVHLFVLMAGLFLPKEHSPVLEHDDGIITGMKRHEGLLRQERAKLERGLELDAKASLPKDPPRGLDSHSVLQAGDQTDESSLKENQSIEMNRSDPPDMEYSQSEDTALSHKDEEPSDLSEELSSQQDVSTERSQSLPHEEGDPEAKNGKLAEDGTHVPEAILSENVETHETETETQPDLSDFSDPEINSNVIEDKGLSHSNEKLSPTEKFLDTDSRMGSQTKPKQSQTSTDSSYMWYLCNAYSLFSLIRILLRCLRGNSPDQEIPEAPQHIPQDAQPISAEISVPDQETLTDFYNQYVHVPTHESQRVCEFVEGFVDDLLAAIRETSNSGDQANLEVEDFLEVGSLYEAWGTGRTLTCDLWVPVSPRDPYSFKAQLSADLNGKAGADVQGYGRVKVLEGGRGTANGCPCSQAGEDDNDDMLCLIHTNNNKEEKRDEVKDAIDGPLCVENTAYLSRTEVARWFRSAARQAWEQMSHKYELELNFWSRELPGAWHIRFRSGRTIHFTVTPVVKFEDMDVCLVSRLALKRRKNDDIVTPEAQQQWPLSFARYERNLLRILGRRLPPNTCHLRCLQILSFLNQKQVGLTGESGLSSYHLKTVLLHLLLDKALPSSAWGPERLADRLRDMLGLLKRSLQTRWLSHALVGNLLITQELGLPASVCQSKPINILQPLLNQGRLYARTVQHFEEMLRNMPVLIQEYMKVQKVD